MSALYKHLRDSRHIEGDGVRLLRDKHLPYLTHGIRHLSAGFESLDASRPWICYWIVHSMALLGKDVNGDLAKDMIDFLNKCQSPSGGFGGEINTINFLIEPPSVRTLSFIIPIYVHIN